MIKKRRRDSWWFMHVICKWNRSTKISNLNASYFRVTLRLREDLWKIKNIVIHTSCHEKVLIENRDSKRWIILKNDFVNDEKQKMLCLMLVTNSKFHKQRHAISLLQTNFRIFVRKHQLTLLQNSFQMFRKNSMLMSIWTTQQSTYNFSFVFFSSYFLDQLLFLSSIKF